MKFELENVKSMRTPMSLTIKLDNDESGKIVDITKYRGMIGSSRPDIMFSVCLCVRFQSNPKESHLNVVEKILKYFHGTMNLGLWYPKGI